MHVTLYNEIRKSLSLNFVSYVCDANKNAWKKWQNLSMILPFFLSFFLYIHPNRFKTFIDSRNRFSMEPALPWIAYFTEFHDMRMGLWLRRYPSWICLSPFISTFDFSAWKILWRVWCFVQFYANVWTSTSRGVVKCSIKTAIQLEQTARRRDPMNWNLQSLSKRRLDVLPMEASPMDICKYLW